MLILVLAVHRVLCFQGIAKFQLENLQGGSLVRNDEETDPTKYPVTSPLDQVQQAVDCNDAAVEDVGEDILLPQWVWQNDFHLKNYHIQRRMLIVIQDVTLDSVEIDFFEMERIMFQTERIAHLIEQFLGRGVVF